MKRFKQYINESVAATARQGMVHLQKMKDAEYVEFVQHLKKTVDGKLTDVEVSLKVDGGGGRFGLDASGRPFFEGSRTGPIFEPKAFSTHAKSKGSAADVVARAEHYDDMWEVVTTSKFIKTLPKDSKVICELFYNPMADITDAGVKFVSITYDKSKLGSLMTIIPFSVVVASTGEPHPDSDKIITSLLKQSSADIKIVSPKLKLNGSIDISTHIDPVLSLDKQSLEVLSSRKKADAEAKEVVRALIQKSKDAVAEYILKHPSIVGKDMLGPDIEGLVLDLNGRQYKVTTAEFKQSKAREKQ